MNRRTSKLLCMPVAPLFVVAVLGVQPGMARAQSIDAFEFGKNSAAAVKLATQLDYLNRVCKGETTPIYRNQVDFVLRHIGRRSASLVEENSAKVMGVAVGRLRDLARDEAKTTLAQSGGCNSANFGGLMHINVQRLGEYQRYLADVADLVGRNPGKEIIR
jgi:hypothetical protein